jgi:hypothetical protein
MVIADKTILVTISAITGPVDTDVTSSIDMPKASPESVARAIFDAVEKGQNSAIKALERQQAALVQAPITE